MKNHKWISVTIWALTLYVLICLIDIITYKFNMIPHSGFQEYSLTEKTFMSLLFFVPMFISVLMLTRFNLKSFIIDVGIFWFLNAVLCKLVNVPFLVSLYVSGFETFAFKVNWLRQDIWFYSYGGTLVGTVLAGVVSFIMKRKKKI